MSKRETILARVRAAIDDGCHATVKRNVAIPVEMNAVDGLVILRDGEPGEPDVTLNPRTEYYSHAAQIEAYSDEDPMSEDHPRLDALIAAIGAALNADPTFGGLVELMTASAPDVSVFAADGGSPIVGALITVVLEYQVSDPLAA